MVVALGILVGLGAVSLGYYAGSLLIWLQDRNDPPVTAINE